MSVGNKRGRVLLISPHFPPDATAGAHRFRVLAPYLQEQGWTPTVLTVAPEFYEGTLDAELAAAFPGSIEVVRCPALPAQWTRRFGVGDLGLRALPHLTRVARQLIVERQFDVVYVTTYPVYHALMGPWLKRTTGVRFVLDLQDPWVGAWGAEVGPRPDGSPDARSAASRKLAMGLERVVLPQADALTGVSSALLDELAVKYPALAERPRLAYPVGMSPRDIDWTSDPADHHGDRQVLRLCYAGTVLPLGLDTIRALFAAVKDVNARHSPGRRIDLQFIGTSNQPRADVTPRLAELARDNGIERDVCEHAPRVPFFDALRALMAADAVMLLGTTEARYTASKLAPALASGRPVLGIFHEASDVSKALRPLASDPGLALVEYGDAHPVNLAIPRIVDVLERWIDHRPPAPSLARAALEPYLAPQLAARVADLLNSVATPAHA